MQNLFLKPSIDADGVPVIVRDPIDMQPLDAAGQWKPRNGYWLDRIRDRDVLDLTAKMKAGRKGKRAKADV